MDALKKQLRSQLQDKRRQLSLPVQERAANIIAHQLFQQPYFHESQHIALYVAFAGEVSTRLILDKATILHKSCYLPVVQDSHMHFIKLHPETLLQKNRFGILEPSLDPQYLIEPATLDLVLLPLVAFDSACHRLGMGGGFYDRTFDFKGAALKPRLVGLAYDFQRVDKIPRSNLDVSLDEVITEKKHYSRYL